VLIIQMLTQLQNCRGEKRGCKDRQKPAGWAPKKKMMGSGNGWGHLCLGSGKSCETGELDLLQRESPKTGRGREG